MTKSKRDRPASVGSPVMLSKTRKKGRDLNEFLVSAIRGAFYSYGSVYVFSFENMRNLKFKELGEQLKSSSRFFLGSNKVMHIALGRSAADGIRPGIRKVSKLLLGNTGLFLTSVPKEEVQKFSLIELSARAHFLCLFCRLFNEFEEYDFARTGSKATEKVELKEGPLTEFTHEMEPFLCEQGIPVRLNKATVGHKDGYLQIAPDLPIERRRLRAPGRGVQ